METLSAIRSVGHASRSNSQFVDVRHLDCSRAATHARTIRTSCSPPPPLVIFPYDPPNVRSIWLRLHFWSRATVARHSSGMYPIADALALSRGKGLHCSLRRSRNRGRRGFGGVDVRGVSPDTSAILIKRSGMAKVARNFTGA